MDGSDELFLYACWFFLLFPELVLSVLTFSLYLFLDLYLVPSFIFPCFASLCQLLLLFNLQISTSLVLLCVHPQMCTVPGPTCFLYLYTWVICFTVCRFFGVGSISSCSLVLTLSCPVLSCPVLSCALLSVCEWSSVRVRPPCWPRCGSRKGSLRC